MTQEELNEVIRLHGLWLENEPEGGRADLRHADLYNADLYNANLRYADLRHADLENANLRYADLRHADLRHADLRNADLRYADLRNADLFIENCRSEKIIQITGLLYHIFIMDSHIKIGCKIYTLGQWQNFTDEDILRMDGKDGLRFWKKYKATILSVQT